MSFPNKLIAAAAAEPEPVAAAAVSAVKDAISWQTAYHVHPNHLNKFKKKDDAKHYQASAHWRAICKSSSGLMFLVQEQCSHW